MPCAMPISRSTVVRSSVAGVVAVTGAVLGASCACSPSDARHADASISTRDRTGVLRCPRGASGYTKCPVPKAQSSMRTPLVQAVEHWALSIVHRALRMFSPEASMYARSIGGAAAAAAIVVMSFAPVTAQRGQGAAQPPDNAPTPRMADGHPDMNGWWGGGGGGVRRRRALGGTHP